MDLPNPDEMIDTAVSHLLDSMTNPSTWKFASKAFSQFLGRGRSTPEDEERRLNDARAKLSAESGDHDAIVSELRSRLAMAVDMREGALGELPKLVTALADTPADQSIADVYAYASDGSNAQAAARDIVGSNQRASSKGWFRRPQ